MLPNPTTPCPECGGPRVVTLLVTHDNRTPKLVQPLRAVGIASMLGGKSSESPLISNQVITCTKCGLAMTRAVHPENLISDPDKTPGSPHD